MEIAEALRASDRGNAEAEQDELVGHKRVGDALFAQGDLDGAMKEYSDFLEIAEDLPKSDANNVSWRRNMSVSESKVGDVLFAQGYFAKARKRESITRNV